MSSIAAAKKMRKKGSRMLAGPELFTLEYRQ